MKMTKAPRGHSLHSAFTIIELMFVIVILGILSAIALPKFATTKNLADVGKGRSDVMAIRSSILTDRQAHIIKGDPDYISGLSQNTTTLFDGNGTNTRTLLKYGITPGTTDGHWSTTDNAAPYIHYNFKVDGVNVPFTYDNATGIFTCVANNAGTTAQKYCYKMTK